MFNMRSAGMYTLSLSSYTAATYYVSMSQICFANNTAEYKTHMNEHHTEIYKIME
jgi:hypothetical protein